jgi:hypothetical protein
MSDTPVKTRTMWRLLNAQWVDNDPVCDCIALTLQSAGKEYVVVCSGPKDMKPNEFIPAIRAASAALLAVTGGKLTDVVGDDSTFDTGDQRAN